MSEYTPSDFSPSPPAIACRVANLLVANQKEMKLAPFCGSSSRKGSQTFKVFLPSPIAQIKPVNVFLGEVRITACWKQQLSEPRLKPMIRDDDNELLFTIGKWTLASVHGYQQPLYLLQLCAACLSQCPFSNGEKKLIII